MKVTKETITVVIADDGTQFKGPDAKAKCLAYEKTQMPQILLEQRAVAFLDIHLPGGYNSSDQKSMVRALAAIAKKPKEFAKLTAGLKFPKGEASKPSPKGKAAKPAKAATKVFLMGQPPAAPEVPKPATLIATFVSAVREDWKLPITAAQYNGPVSDLLKLVPEAVLKSCREVYGYHLGLKKIVKAPSRG